MRANAGRHVTEYEVQIFSTTYAKSATMDRVISGFRASGLWPKDDGIFTYEDFAPTTITDEAWQDVLPVTRKSQSLRVTARRDQEAASAPEPQQSGS